MFIINWIKKLNFKSIFLGRYSEWYLLALFVLLCGGYGVWRGEKISLDFMNYHLYNAYAFMEGRFYTDLMPAGIHTFLNPLPDVPLYLLIKYFNDFPRLVCFVYSSISGFLLFFFYKFCLLMLGRKPWYWVLFAVLAACGGYMFHSQMGTSNNDVLLNIFAAWGVYWVFRFLFVKPHQKSYLFWAAFIMGGAVGLKYALAPVAIASFAVLCVNFQKIHKPWKTLLIFAALGVAGFLVTNGYFMWRLWGNYESPVFPFYNEWFKSPFFEEKSVNDPIFYPHNVWQWVFFPFLRFMQYEPMVSEVLFDYRLAVGYISFFLMSLYVLCQRKLFSASSAMRLHRRKMISFLVLFGIMYVTWIVFFGGILRYLIVLEMYSCLLCIYYIKMLPLRKWISVLLAVSVLILLGTTTYMGNWGEARMAFKEKFIVIKPNLPKIEPKPLIVFWGSPMSFLAPFLPKDAVFVGGIKYPQYPDVYWILRGQVKSLNLLSDVYFRHKLYDRIKERIAAYPGPIYMVSVPWELMLDPATLAPYGLEKTDEPCVYFNSNANVSKFRRSGWVLCKLQKITASREEKSSLPVKAS